MMKPLIAGLALVGALATPAAGQRFFNVGQEVDGKINVEITATLSDGSGEYHPVVNQAVTLYRNATDSMRLELDDAGVLRFAIAPGTYRISTMAQWHGRVYRWNLALPVQRGMRTLALTSDNAAIAAATQAQRPVITQRDAPRESASPQPAEGQLRSNKEGSTAVLWSVLFTGAGQIYAGETGKGWALLGTSVAAGVLGLAAVSSSQNSSLYGESNDGADVAAVLLLSYSVGAWVYSMVDAPAAVRRYNARNGYAAHPIIGPNDDRGFRVGLSLQIPR